MTDFSIKRNAEHYSDPTAFRALQEITKGEKKMKSIKHDMQVGDVYEMELQNDGRIPVVVCNNAAENLNMEVAVITCATTAINRYCVPLIIEGRKRYAAVTRQSYSKIEKMGKFIRTLTEPEVKEIRKMMATVNGFDAEPPEDPEKVRQLQEQLEYADDEIQRLKDSLQESDASWQQAEDDNIALANKCDSLMRENESLKIQLGNTVPEEAIVMLHKAEAERDVYKQQYEALLEKLIAR